MLYRALDTKLHVRCKNAMGKLNKSYPRVVSVLDPREFNGAEKQPEKLQNGAEKQPEKLQNRADKAAISESFVIYEYGEPGPGTPKNNKSTSTHPSSFLFEG